MSSSPGGKIGASSDSGRWCVAKVDTPDNQVGLHFHPEDRRGSNITAYLREGTPLHKVGNNRIGDFVYVRADGIAEGWLKSTYVQPAGRFSSKGPGSCIPSDLEKNPAVEARGTGELSARAPWVDGSGHVDIAVKGSDVTVRRNDETLVAATAPYHTFAHLVGALPAFDTHSSAFASTCLAELLPQCDLVALVVSDEASKCWNDDLTAVLRSMGAKNVPPSYRASWVFLWTPEGCYEKYNQRGVAEVKAQVRGRDFELHSAGYWYGQSGQIKIDGKAYLPEGKFSDACRGVGCYLTGVGQTALTDKRCFDRASLLVNYLSQIEPGSRCMAVCGVKTRNNRYQRLPSVVYEEFMKLGGSGLAFGPSDTFLLSGVKQSSSMPKREMPSIASFPLGESRSKVAGSYAFVSLLFGSKPSMCLGAVVLAESLRKHSPDIPRILLVAEDVPEHFRPVLHQSGWCVKEVPCIHGAFTHFHEDAKFATEVFMKLHVFNAAILPFEKVLFLDVDTLVRKDISSVFRLQTPAAVSNWKDGKSMDCPAEGEVLNPERTSINAGVLLCSPNQALFDVLKTDAERAGVHHHAAWAPEQWYLATMFRGQLRHLHCRYNFEPQIHGGTCTSRDWTRCEIDDVSVVHFSGSKPWELSTHDEISCIARAHYESNRTKYRVLESHYHRVLASQRCRVFHEEWFSQFEELDFLKDPSLDGRNETAEEGVVPEVRMEAYLRRVAKLGPNKRKGA
eukprot:TRINITY_DN4711_c0_g6_i1.p1 TRINITY_DN4711_c0_g6~~TRINITY_DN4711_c0_g6_i1.p1  ORF type:complete len:734 (+),score=73.98 TRINITY_DN4711_c0_g6_i1:63-2264(+)